MPRAVASIPQVTLLNDAIRCSPSCGFGCTRFAFERATAEAAALAQRMGPGWEPHVWENGGWFYQIAKGRSEIHVHTKGSHISGKWVMVDYGAWINLDPPIGSDTCLQFIQDAATPEEALAKAVHSARMTVQRINNQLAELLCQDAEGLGSEQALIEGSAL